ncbi:DUF6236 family protein [Streptomyces sp. NPDC058145]|uniref:DUF6236 family protein n=1 Tax=Streptomyces sp. NPDC058145 TaxID=3346356 RepID=UPI0036E20024
MAAEVGRRTAFAPPPDQVAAHMATDLWDAERMAAVLLGETETLMSADDLTSRVGVLSMEYVLPERLASVPTDKIVEQDEVDAAATVIAVPVAENAALRDQLARRSAVVVPLDRGHAVGA